MEKIKLDIKNKKNKFIKIGKQKIEIKPYISSEELVLITQLCLKKLIIDSADLANSVLLHTIFDMCVIELCSSIHIDGIKCPTKKSNTIELNLDNDKFLKYDILDISDQILINICNYEQSWRSIFEIMQIASINNAFGLIMKNIPNEESLQGAIQQLKDGIEEINKRDPETLKNIVKIAGENNAFVKTKSEFSEKQKEEKMKNLDKIVKGIMKKNKKDKK